MVRQNWVRLPKLFIWSDGDNMTLAECRIPVELNESRQNIAVLRDQKHNGCRPGNA